MGPDGARGKEIYNNDKMELNLVLVLWTVSPKGT